MSIGISTATVTFVYSEAHAHSATSLWTTSLQGIDGVTVQSTPPESCTCDIKVVTGQLRDRFETQSLGAFYEVLVTDAATGHVELFEVPQSEVLDVTPVDGLGR